MAGVEPVYPAPQKKATAKILSLDDSCFLFWHKRAIIPHSKGDAMTAKQMGMIFLGLIILSWFLIGERKTFREKLGSLVFFLALYFFYQMLNAEKINELITRIKEIIGTL